MKKTNEPYCHFRGRTLFDGDGFAAHNSDEFGGYVGPLSPTIRSSKFDAAVCLLVDDEPEVIPFDDFNGAIPEDRNIIGSVTPQFGGIAPRNGWKIITVKTDKA